MLKIKKILFPTDFSKCAGYALNQVLLYARSYKAELHILHTIVFQKDDPFIAAALNTDAERTREKFTLIGTDKINHMIEAFPTSGIKIKKITLLGTAVAPSIVVYSKENEIDLIIMGTHGRRGLSHLLLGSVAEEVIRTSKLPVLTIRQIEENKQAKQIKNILVPIDFSIHSQRALVYAKEIASFYKARLQLLHIIELNFHPSPAFYMANRQSLFDLAPDVWDDSKKELSRLVRSSHGPNVEADLFIVEGYAQRDILAFAESHHSDMVVLSSHGLTGLDRFMLGSVAEKVIRRAPCPVFIVKSFGKSIV